MYDGNTWWSVLLTIVFLALMGLGVAILTVTPS